MRLNFKEIVLIALVTLITFPILFFIMLVATGSAKIVLKDHTKDFVQKYQTMRIMKHSDRRDSLYVMQTELYHAAQKEREEVDHNKLKLQKHESRLIQLEEELKRKREMLAKDMDKLEKLVGQSDELTKKRIKQLAKIYGAMRANEAAQILETLDDGLLIKILNSINDERQKGKIMSNLSKSKASRISKKMGKPIKS